MVQYKIEWFYKNGSNHFTYANTLEMAEQKANVYIENDDVYLICISEYKLIKIVKENLE